MDSDVAASCPVAWGGDEPSPQCAYTADLTRTTTIPALQRAHSVPKIALIGPHPAQLAWPQTQEAPIRRAATSWAGADPLLASALLGAASTRGARPGRTCPRHPPQPVQVLLGLHASVLETLAICCWGWERRDRWILVMGTRDFVLSKGAAPLAAVALLVLGAPLALAGEDCLWYLDRNGSWHPGFNCEFFTFCCGTCYQRYCCRDLSLLITERQQKHCLAFSPKTIAGVASAVILFVAVVATTICCFLCSCCYLYRRRQQLQSPLEGQEIPMTGVPAQPAYPYPQDPKAGPAPPQPGFMYPPSGPAPQYPLYPAGPPVYNPAAPPPYVPPQPSYPGA
ncbi:protein shisa-4 [Oryx dammah]|uniref:protein shisa-4 n=1 Tax=Oryx dammah TaxID=59534 RepID=UPI001A9B24C8|nr:protein shisa-4 [Oryx dammah]